MKRILVLMTAVMVLGNVFFLPHQAQAADEIGQKTQSYFAQVFKKLESAAAQAPTPETFRDVMRPVIGKVEGVYGATLVGADWVIQQVYFPSHFLARGFDLKKVKQLDYFYTLMQKEPGPQLSEPGHGNLMQPALIAMRYPIIKNGEMKGFISLMLRTKTFLDAVGLSRCKAYEIICLGKLAERRGRLSKDYKEVTLSLPSTTWVIRYDK